MAIAEDVGIRVALLGRPEFLSATEGVRKALGDLGSANAKVADSSKVMSGATKAQQDALKAVSVSTEEAVAAQREYEAALGSVVVAERAAAEGDATLTEADRRAAAARLESAKVARDSAVQQVEASKVAAAEEMNLAERTRLANVERMSSYDALRASSLGSMLGMRQASVGLAETEADAAARIEASNAAKVASYDAVGKHFGMVGAGIVGVAGVVIGATVKMAGDFQSQTQRLVSSAGEVEGNLEGVRRGILDMAGQVGYSTTELAGAMYKVESGGQHGAAGLQVLKAAAQGAKAENADLTVVADAVTSALTDYHFGADQAANVTSKLVAATASGKMTFEELSRSMANILPVASAAHVSLDDILADEASMTMHGMTAQRASMNLANAIRAMQAPSQVQQKEFFLLGLNAQQVSETLGQKGLSGSVNLISDAIKRQMGPGATEVVLSMTKALQGLAPPVRELGQRLVDGTINMGDYVKSAKDLPPELQGQATSFAALAKSTHNLGGAQVSGSQVLQTYAGALNKAMGGATGMNVALMIGGENAQNTANAYKAVSGATADAAGNVAHWDEIQKTFNQRAAEAKAGLGAFAISVGQELLPVVSAILAPLGAVASFLAQHRALAVAVAGVLVTALVTGLAMVTIALWNAVIGIGAVDIALLGLTEVPIVAVVGAIVGAITLLVIGLTLAWHHSETFRDIVTGAFGVVKAVAAGAVAVVVAVLHGIGDAVDWVKQHWELLTVVLSPILIPLGLVAVALAANAAGFLAAAAASAVYRGAQAVAAAVTWATSASNWANAASLAWSAVKYGVATAAGWVYAGASKAWAAAQWALNLAMDANPIGLLIVGLLAVGGAIAYAVTHWQEITDWVGRHKAVAIALGVVIGTILVVAIWAMSGAIWGAVTAVGSLTIALLANPITWIVLAIVAAVALLALGVYELIKHWDTVWHAMGTSVDWFYRSVLTPIGHFFSAVFNGIVTVLKWAGAILFTVLVYPYVLAFNLLKGPTLAFWHGVVEPAMHGIGALFTWLRTSAVEPAVHGIAATWQWLQSNVFIPLHQVMMAGLRLLGSVFTWLWQVPIMGAAHGIEAAWSWLENNVFIPLHQLMMAGLRLLGSVFTWLWQVVVMGAVHGIEAAWRWLNDTVLTPIGNLIMTGLRLVGSVFTWLWHNAVEPAIQGIASLWHWVHDNVIKPVGDAINAVVHGIGQAFSDTVDWIKRTWQTISDIVSVPVRFVVNTVYGKGIKPTWDAIAGVFGLPPAPAGPAFAQGGVVDDAQGGAGIARAALGRVMPGYEPGHDRFTIRVGGGEAIMVPEWTRMMMRHFGPSEIERQNHAARAGRHPFGHWAATEGNLRSIRNGPDAGAMGPGPGRGYSVGGVLGFADGGAVGDLPAVPMPREGPSVSIGADILKSLANVFDIPELIVNPQGYFTGLFKPFTDPLNGMGGSRFMQSMKDVPAKAIGGIVQKVKDYIASMFSSGSASIGPMSASHVLDIKNAAKAKGLGRDAAVIAVMTGIQESGVRVLANPNVPASMGLFHEGVGHDHDSVGIFQQRQSWGPTPLLMNPFGSAELFYNKLGRGPYGSFGAAAQRVQVSAFPGAYAGHQGQAEQLVGAFGSGGIVGVSGGMPFGGFRAVGGDISPGSAYMVGENGPELVTPSRPGTVVPADISAAGGEPSTTPAPEGLGRGRRGDVYFNAGAIVVNGATDPRATAQMVADEVSDRMARQ